MTAATRGRRYSALCIKAAVRRCPLNPNDYLNPTLAKKMQAIKTLSDDGVGRLAMPNRAETILYVYILCLYVSSGWTNTPLTEKRAPTSETWTPVTDGLVEPSHCSPQQKRITLYLIG